MSTKRWYTVLTWDDWPEGGSYSDIIEAGSSSEAEDICRTLMAEARINDLYEGTHEEKVAEILEDYNDSWELVDCWDVDEFIERHRN